jgi:hypothetical protein
MGFQTSRRERGRESDIELGTLMSYGLDGTLLRCRFDSSNSDLCRDSYAN